MSPALTEGEELCASQSINALHMVPINQWNQVWISINSYNLYSAVRLYK